jgi:hypothetical protein
MVPQLLLAICWTVAGQATGGDGSISGIVVNASRGRTPAGGSEVILRLRLHGQFVPAAQTTADPQGRFSFQNLLVGGQYQYLPGANRDGVHYPGPRIQLTPQRPRVRVELAVHDAVTQPNPLVIRRHDIIVRPEPGALNVTESILVVNPSSKSYIGRPLPEGGEPVTLQLAVPSDFERLTFYEEFFGREFSLIHGKLVTSIPWTPGQRELKLNYVLRNTQSHRVWERPLDLPCSQVRLCVETTRPEKLRCNLERGSVERNGDLSTVRFQSVGRTLPAGHVIRLELGELPLPWTTYGRPAALLILLALMGGASLVMVRRRHRTGLPSAKAALPARPPGPANPASQRRLRYGRRKRGRKHTESSRL